MKITPRAAAAAAALCLLAPAGLAEAPEDPILPIDAEQVQLRKVTLMPTGLPERATGVDAPIDMSAGNATAQSMVNSGQVSPAAGAAGGIIGMLVVAAIDAGVDSNRNGKIAAMLKEQGFDARQVFESALVEALNERDIVAGYQAGTREKNDEFFNFVATPGVALDAAIDVVVYQYGFTLDGLVWRPSVAAQVKIRDIKTGQLIMNELLTYGRGSLQPPAVIMPNSYAVEPGAMTIVIPYDRKNAFGDVKGFTEEDPARAAATLTEALKTTARAIADLAAKAAAGEAEVVATEGAAP